MHQHLDFEFADILSPQSSGNNSVPGQISTSCSPSPCPCSPCDANLQLPGSREVISFFRASYHSPRALACLSFLDAEVAYSHFPFNVSRSLTLPVGHLTTALSSFNMSAHLHGAACYAYYAYSLSSSILIISTHGCRQTSSNTSHALPVSSASSPA